MVVGASPEQLLALGYQPVGKDFPVFLHPQTHEEYGLARTERKTAPGYHGFAFYAASDVTLEQDLARLDAMWTEALAQSGGPFLFGEFSAADAFYAPVALRVQTYALPLSETARACVQRLLAAPGVRDWIEDALAEQDFLDFEEPYRTARA